MYSPSSPAFSSLDRSSAIANAAAIHSSSCCSSTTSHNFPHFSGASLTTTDASCTTGTNKPTPSRTTTQCVKFKYFLTFLLSTACLALLSASLATHKWIVSRPIRILRLKDGTGGQTTNLTSLMLSAQQDSQPTNHDRYRYPSALLLSLSAANSGSNEISPTIYLQQSAGNSQKTDNKFQGEIYFGLFKGVKVLNYGFGDRYIPISGE